MWAFLGVGGLIVSVIFGVLGFKSLKKSRDVAKKRFIIAGIAFVCFVVALAADPSTPETTTAESTQKASSSNVAEKASDSEKAAAKKKEDEVAAANKAAAEKKKKAEEAAKLAAANTPEALAKKAIFKHFDAAAIQFNNKTGHIVFTASGKDNFTNKMILHGMWMDITDTLKDIRDIKEIKDVTFQITFNMVDKFGNESQEVVMKVEMSKETRDQINWKNFIFSNLPDIADSYWQHPGI